MLSLKECAYLLDSAIEFESPLTGFCVDTRLLKKGHLFFALPGSHTDGHHFLKQAASLGAAGAVVESGYKGSDYGLPLIKVPNALDALQSLAKQVVAQNAPKIIAITGSVGKTTTKEFVSTLVGKKYVVAKTPGNSNSQIGLPLALLNNTNGYEEVLVLEMSLSDKGHIAKLIDIAPPDIAMITMTALVHAENFDSLEDISRAKAEIFSHPKTSLGIMHHDIVNFTEICAMGSCFKISFSTSNKNADYFLEDAGDRIRISGSRFEAAALNGLKVYGKHNRHNFLAAAVAARALGVAWTEIEDSMQDLVLPQKRFELIEKQGILFIDDSYNASQSSVIAALESLPLPKGDGKRIAVLGEMLELGKFSAACHQSVGRHSLNLIDMVICYGRESHPIHEIWKNAGRPTYFTTDQAELFKYVKDIVRPGDVVLLKGSRSKSMWKILDEFTL